MGYKQIDILKLKALKLRSKVGKIVKKVGALRLNESMLGEVSGKSKELLTTKEEGELNDKEASVFGTARLYGTKKSRTRSTSTENVEVSEAEKDNNTKLQRNEQGLRPEI